MAPEVAIRTALIIEVFGLTSDQLSYARRWLIDYRLGTAPLVITTPMALPGTCTPERIEPDVRKAILAVGLLAVAASALRKLEAKATEGRDEPIRRDCGDGRDEICLIAAEGEEICYTMSDSTEGK